MELEIFEALTAINLPADKARSVAVSIKKKINEHYARHAAQLATKADLADAKTEIIKWTIGTMFAAVGLFAAITKLWQ